MPTHMLMRVITLNGIADMPKAAGSALVELPVAGLSTGAMPDLAANRLGVVLSTPADARNIETVIELGKTGPLRYINVIVDTNQEPGSTIAMAKEWAGRLHEAGSPLCFETHPSTADAILQAIPTARFTLNATPLQQADNESKLHHGNQAIINHTEIIRCTLPQGVPNNLIDLPDILLATWEQAMRSWRQRNKPGSTMLALLTPEAQQVWSAVQAAWKASARPSAAK